MKIYGVIGYPVKHSLSPDMHNAAFKSFGIDAEYRKFEVRPEDLEDFLLNRKDVTGFNITIPHKIRAKQILSKKSDIPEDVKLTGAINTVKREKDSIICLNTDISGFGHSLENDLLFQNTMGKAVLIIGCGGAARAVIAYLLTPGNFITKIYVYDIDSTVIESSKKHFSMYKKIEFLSSEEDIKSKIGKCHLCVNTSPVGMKEGDPSPVKKGLLRKELYVYDVVYNRETQLVKDARETGCKAVTGEGMLANQGAFSFSCWTGYDVERVIGIMKEALLKKLNRA